jgi:hypothetical protein
MNVRCLIVALAFMAASLPAGRAQDFLDRLGETLSFTGFNDNVRARVSGTLDLEYYHFQQPAPGLILTEDDSLFNARLSLFFDAQLGPKVYVFLQSRVDTGFDPTDHGVQLRLDEYALRYTPWEDGRLNIQIGTFGSVVGNWIPRHLSWENPFVTAPVPYEVITKIEDKTAPFPGYLTQPGGIVDEKEEYLPSVIWGPSYASGVSVAGRLGQFDYAAEVKNASLASRPPVLARQCDRLRESYYQHPPGVSAQPDVELRRLRQRRRLLPAGSAADLADGPRFRRLSSTRPGPGHQFCLAPFAALGRVF